MPAERLAEDIASLAHRRSDGNGLGRPRRGRARHCLHSGSDEGARSVHVQGVGTPNAALLGLIRSTVPNERASGLEELHPVDYETAGLALERLSISSVVYRLALFGTPERNTRPEVDPGRGLN